MANYCTYSSSSEVSASQQATTDTSLSYEATTVQAEQVLPLHVLTLRHCCGAGTAERLHRGLSGQR